MTVHERLSASDIKKLSKAELEKKLEGLRALLCEVDEERLVILGQENLHLHAAIAKNYEDELFIIKDNISLLEGMLNK